MPAYQTVLTGVHDSTTGARAVEFAAMLASETGARLLLVAAYAAHTPHSGAGDDENYQEPGRTAAERTLRKAVDKCAEVGVRNVETFAVAGDPASALTTTARDKGADLLLVGSRGLSTLVGRLLGSVPSEVTRQANCDVLIVHTTSDRWRKLLSRRFRHRPSVYQRTVVAGVHDSPRSMRAAEKAAEIAADAGAELILVGAYAHAEKKVLAHAYDTLKGESFLARGVSEIESALWEGALRARARGAHQVDRVISEGDTIQSLLMVADRRRADLIVVGNHQLEEGGAARLIGSIGSRVTRNTPTHVLLVH